LVLLFVVLVLLQLQLLHLLLLELLLLLLQFLPMLLLEMLLLLPHLLPHLRSLFPRQPAIPRNVSTTQHKVRCPR
jgi:hypothetical protein